MIHDLLLLITSLIKGKYRKVNDTISKWMEVSFD